jgi:hypothetical protein
MVADWHRLFVASLLGVEPASECGLSQPRFWRLSQIAVVAVLPRPLHRFLQHVLGFLACATDAQERGEAVALLGQQRRDLLVVQASGCLSWLGAGW